MILLNIRNSWKKDVIQNYPANYYMKPYYLLLDIQYTRHITYTYKNVFLV